MKKYKEEVAALKDEFDIQHQNKEIEDFKGAQGMKKYKEEVAALKDEFDTQHQNKEIEDLNDE